MAILSTPEKQKTMDYAFAIFMRGGKTPPYVAIPKQSQGDRGIGGIAERTGSPKSTGAVQEQLGMSE
jgi:hypothetical protein